MTPQEAVEVLKEVKKGMPYNWVEPIRVVDLAISAIESNARLTKEVEELREALRLSVKQLEFIECPQGCSGGAFQYSEDEVVQCQWCDELARVKYVLAKTDAEER